jgi:small conductance mechanosensitive channel
VELKEDDHMSVKALTIDLAVRYGFQVLGAIVILVVGIVLARWIGNLTQRWLERQEMEPPVRTLTVRTVRIVVLLMVLVAALDKFGLQIAPLIAGIGIAGVGIGIALQGVLANVFAGLTIIFTKPFRVGEYIELLGVHGQVTAVELFSTTLIHTDLSRVVIPNRKIVGEILHNYGTVRQLNIKIGVAIGTNLNGALTLVREIIGRNPRVLKEPSAVVGVSVVGDSAITILVQPWVAVPDFVDAQVELYQSIIEGFRANKIEIPLPQREVRLLTTS